MNKSSGIYNLINSLQINKSITNVLASGVDFNTYASPKGLKELRLQIGKFLMSLWNYQVDYHNILITNGSQQSLTLIANSILTSGDTILMEQPSYYGAIKVFKQKNINIIGTKLNSQSLNLKQLENQIIKYKPKLIYVTPTFNNPTGYTWSNNNRQKFLDIINKYNVLVLEDAPYSLINFTNTKYKSLYQLNNGKNIIYLGTFSKYISPSINVGYILSDIHLDQIYTAKENFDLCTSLFTQYIVLDFLKNNNLPKLIKQKIPYYKKLKDLAIKELNQTYPNLIDKIYNSKGGIFIFVKFKQHPNSNSFANGEQFFIKNNNQYYTRINICHLKDSLTK